MKKVMVYITVLCVVLLVGCGTKTEANQTTQPKKEKPVVLAEKKPDDPNKFIPTEEEIGSAKVTYCPSDRITYTELSELEKRTDLVVEGSFTGNTTQEVDFSYNPETNENDMEYGKSKRSFQITKVLKGDKNLDRVDISMEYWFEKKEGQLEIVSYSSLSPMKDGEKWLMFLHYDKELKRYWFEGDSTGRFPIPSKEQINARKQNVKLPGVNANAFEFINKEIKPNSNLYKAIIQKYYLS
jgi:hypothetical protein